VLKSQKKFWFGFSAALTLASTICVILLLFPIATIPGTLAAQENTVPVQWQDVADDLSLGSYNFSHYLLFSSRMTLVKTSLHRYRLGVLRAAELGKRRASISELSKSKGAIFGINANFFDEKGQPLGLVLSDGTLHKPVHGSGKVLTGVFQVTRDSVSILRRSDFNLRNVLDAVQAGPRLLLNGEKISGLSETASYSRRAGVCLTKDNEIIFFCLDSGFFGLTFEELQEFLIREDVGCVDALNFDGGGSAQLYLDSKLPGSPDNFQSIYIAGRDKVPVGIGLFLRPD